jgi:hypothetical protein
VVSQGSNKRYQAVKRGLQSAVTPRELREVRLLKMRLLSAIAHRGRWDGSGNSCEEGKVRFGNLAVRKDEIWGGLMLDDRALFSSRPHGLDRLVGRFNVARYLEPLAETLSFIGNDGAICVVQLEVKGVSEWRACNLVSRAIGDDVLRGADTTMNG